MLLNHKTQIKTSLLCEIEIALKKKIKAKEQNWQKIDDTRSFIFLPFVD